MELTESRICKDGRRRKKIGTETLKFRHFLSLCTCRRFEIDKTKLSVCFLCSRYKCLHCYNYTLCQVSLLFFEMKVRKWVSTNCLRNGLVFKCKGNT